jgi:hypothetical protein
MIPMAPKGQILPGTSQAQGPRGRVTLECRWGMTEGEVAFVDLCLLPQEPP